MLSPEQKILKSRQDYIAELEAENKRLRGLLYTCKREMRKYNFPTMSPIIKAIEDLDA